MEKPRGIIFSSSTALLIAQAVQAHTERWSEVDIWTQNFFDENNTTPLNTFLKKLLCFDFAIIILAPDDILESSEPGTFVPRDNVVFELGACMARLGTKKTFVIAPSDRQMKLPSYLTGLYPLQYRHELANLASATGTACAQIHERFQKLHEDAYHSDLPALGVAYGYFSNFVSPIELHLRERQTISFSGTEHVWQPDHGFKLYVILPEAAMTRPRIEAFLHKLGAQNVTVKLAKGRDVNVYALAPSSENGELRILDIPSTLMTSDKVIDRVNSFWGGTDASFKTTLMKREIITFGRRLKGLIEEEQFDGNRIQVVGQNRIAEVLK